jgi:hypothetical protein
MTWDLKSRGWAKHPVEKRLFVKSSQISPWLNIDCDGPGGCSETLEALTNPDHPERERWFGGAFEPEVFDLEAVN